MKEGPNDKNIPAEEFGFPPVEDGNNYEGSSETAATDGSFMVGDIEQEPIHYSQN